MASNATASFDGANGGQRGRGSWRGRGRDGYRGGNRGGGGGPARASEGNSRNGVRGESNARAQESREPKPPLTHFLAMPLGHHPELRARVSAFTRALLASEPAVPGLDESIVVAPRRLHITLGVMSLSSSAPSGSAPPGSAQEDAQPTLAAARTLLHALQPRVQALLRGTSGSAEASAGPLRVALQHVDIMRPDGGDPARAHVLWAGPRPDSEDARRLKRVAEFVNAEFRKAGLVVDERRPLKLHCTILNTVYRRPMPKGPRVPFSYPAILASPAFETIKVKQVGTVAGASQAEAGGTQENTTTSVTVAQRRQPKQTTVAEVDLGEYTIDEIQICEMGSWGPEGEYVCVDRITLH